MSDALVEAAGVRVSYRGHEAVRGVDLRVAAGEVYAVLGTNGAGKTTLLECLEGLRAPSAGEVRVLGRDPFRERAATRPEMGIMLQDGGFAGDLTVRETVELWRRVTSRAGATDDALERMALGHRAGVAVKQLSGGERRRLDVVLATLSSPRILFLDEPTTGLDPESRAAAWEVIGALRDAGTTIVLTTHYLEEAERLADRVMILHEGMVAVSGSLGEVAASERASIRFTVPASVSAAATARLDGLSGLVGECERVGSGILIRTDDLQHDLFAVLRWADAGGIAIPDVRATPATLEDVFAGVVARARDGATHEGSAS